MASSSDSRATSPDRKSAVTSDAEKSVGLAAPVHGVGGVGGTQRRLKGRHVTWIGIGSGIGTGLLVGTGPALASAGPAGLFLAYLITGSILWATMQSIGELATLIPTAGTFPHYASRFIDPAVGFTLGISYYLCYAISIASEVVACAVLVSFWSDISAGVIITAGLVPIVALNFCSVRVYGESEVIASSIKVLLFLGLMLLSLILTLGGGPNHDRIGFRYWKQDGAFQVFPGFSGSLGQFLAFFSAFINAAYSYVGIEVVALVAGESKNPTKHIPRAIRRIVWRILFFYVGGTFLIGMIVSANNPDLVSGSGTAASSPFVVAIVTAGIPILPHIVNAAVITSAWSAGSAYLYTASRTIFALALEGHAPKIFTRTNSYGVPVWAVAFSSLFGLLGYLSLGAGGAGQAFTWLQNISAVAGLFAWGTLCLAFLRFRSACIAQGVDRNEFAFKGAYQPFTAYFGLIGSAIVILFSGWSVFLDGNWDTSSFFASYVGVGLFVIPLIFWKVFKRTKVQRAATIDLWSGRMRPEDEEEDAVPTTKFGRAMSWLA